MAENQITGTISFGGATAGSNNLFFDLPLSSVAAFQDRALNFLSNNSARNQGFINQVNQTANAAVDRTESRFFGFTQSGMDSLNATTRFNIEAMQQVNRISQEYATTRTRYATRRSGCFITTAACEVMGKTDDCHELQVLRHFRDTFMAADIEGQNMVAEYYETAPDILAKIKADFPDGWADIMRCFFERFIVPAVAAIESGDTQKALQLYVCLYVVAKTAAWGV